MILFRTRMGVFQEDTKKARKTIQNGEEGVEGESGNNAIKVSLNQKGYFKNKKCS